MDKGINKHYLLLHFIVFIWGFSPVLGRFITADTWQLVWFRILITVLVMFLYLKLTKQSLVVNRKDLLKLCGIGLIILVHWLAFYGAIKVSNISVTMVAFSTGTLFSSIIEPILYKRKIKMYEIVIGLVIIAAIGLIFSIETTYWKGILFGIFAALTSSLFGVLNGLMVKRVPSGAISFYELSAALLGLTIFLACSGSFTTDFFVLDQRSMIGLLLLSLVCTVFPFLAAVNLAKYISPYTIVLTVNLETVYGIIWAIIFFKENKEVKPTFYLGVLIILLAVFLNSYLKNVTERKLLNAKPE
ncbi:MAG: DMT family transporter [Bacteroidetes bacterium]|nr:DMT family transporter [Bacteroidota bacterium]